VIELTKQEISMLVCALSELDLTWHGDSAYDGVIKLMTKLEEML